MFQASPSPFNTEQSTANQVIDIKSLLKLGESKEWAIPVIKPLDQLPLGAKRTRAGDAKLKSNVPAACRVSNRREKTINPIFACFKAARAEVCD